jgi:hypothetical protein
MLVLRFPESSFGEIEDVVDEVVTVAGDARHRVGFHLAQYLRIGVVCRTFFKGSRAEMAVEALPVIVGCIQAHFSWLRSASNIVHVHVSQSTPFGPQISKEGVIRVARVTGLVSGNPAVQEVPRGKIAGVL